MKWVRRGAFLTACAGAGVAAAVLVVGRALRRHPGTVMVHRIEGNETGPEAFERELLPRLRVVG